MTDIIDIIKASGSISIAEFMALSASAIGSGYYHNKDVITCDFITSPEITPLFGMYIGAQLVQKYFEYSTYPQVHIVELGPGSGLMMRDILKFISTHGHCMKPKVHLVEISERLTRTQRANLAEYKDIQWHSSYPKLEDGLVFVIANEFFDALPIDQFIMTGDGWRERRIAWHDYRLIFSTGANLPAHLSPSVQVNGICRHDIVEISNATISCVRTIADDIRFWGGFALFFDYGYTQPPLTSTLRAIKNHEYADIFTPGADISAAVDFAAISRYMPGAIICSQQEILGHEISALLIRDMGDLFKALSFSVKSPIYI